MDLDAKTEKAHFNYVVEKLFSAWLTEIGDTGVHCLKYLGSLLCTALWGLAADIWCSPDQCFEAGMNYAVHLSFPLYSALSDVQYPCTLTDSGCSQDSGNAGTNRVWSRPPPQTSAASSS